MAQAPGPLTPSGDYGAKGIQALGWQRNARAGLATLISQTDGARYNTLQAGRIPVKWFFGDVVAPFFPAAIPQTPDATGGAASPVNPTYRK